MLEDFFVATILCGFFGILFKKNLLRKIVSMDVMITGVIAYYYVFGASSGGFFTPIVAADAANNVVYADSFPQAVILTAIVMGLSIQALMLVDGMKLA